MVISSSQKMNERNQSFLSEMPGKLRNKCSDSENSFHRSFLRSFWMTWPLVLVLFSVSWCAEAATVEDRSFWYAQANEHIQNILEARKSSKGHAKNIIMFIGDGMGVTTVTAGRIFKGQSLGQSGEEYQLSFDKFPYVALAKTYNIDSQIGDSSACATALMCGVKGNVNTVGLDQRGRFGDCMSSYTARVSSLIDWAQKHGKSTGIVTNTRLTHGTPSALYAHSASRYWEDDSKMPDATKAICKDIARQLVEDDPGKNINVLLGGGRRHFLPNSTYDREERDQTGRRTDGRNLVDDWVHDKKNRGLHAEYVWNKAQFDQIDASRTDYLLGIFGYSHMEFEVDRNKGPSGDPSLSEMTLKAIQILKKNPHGYFLMVEAGRIDHAHHHNNGKRALLEMCNFDDTIADAMQAAAFASDTLFVVTSDHSHVVTFGGENTPRGHPVTAGRMDHAHHYNMAARAFDEVNSLEESVNTAIILANNRDTLLIVTSDHSHTLTLGGMYVPRGHSILGLDSEVSDLDQKPYTTLLYGNGPGYAHSTPKGRHDLTGINTQDINFVQQAAVPRKYETHGGEDVPVYSVGPGSYLLSGTIEQTYIAHAIAYAACISNDNSHCEKPPSDDACASAPLPTIPLYPRQPPAPTPVPVEERKSPRDPWAWSNTGYPVYETPSRFLTAIIIYLILR